MYTTFVVKIPIELVNLFSVLVFRLTEISFMILFYYCLIQRKAFLLQNPQKIQLILV